MSTDFAEIFGNTTPEESVGVEQVINNGQEDIPLNIPEPGGPRTTPAKGWWKPVAEVEHEATLRDYVGVETERELHELAEQTAGKILEQLKGE